MQLKDMLSFYSNGKVFGCYYIVTFILLESNSASHRAWLRGEFKESGEMFYSYTNGSAFASCLERGKLESTLVDAIRVWVYVDESYTESLLDLTKANSGYKSLIDKVTIDCNGRPECSSSYSGLTIPKPKYLGVPVDYIEIRFSCKPKNVDNITSFDISLNLEFPQIKSKPASYPVLRLQNNKNTHRHCKINGNQSHINITVLHVDFGPNSECNKSNSDSFHQCHENMTLLSRNRTDCNYTWNSSVTFKIVECKAMEVDIDIHMSTGFVWIEIEAGFNLKCSGSESNNDFTTTSSYNPTVLTDTTHSTTTNISVTNENGSNTNEIIDSRQFDVVYTIMIPLNVTFLILLTAVVSFVYCVCRRCKRSRRKRINNYDFPAMRQEDSHPYGVPIGPSEVPHYNHINGNLEVSHGDDGYLEPTVVFPRQEQAVVYEEINL